MIFGPTKPIVSLSIGGFVADLVLGGNLRSFTYHDAHHGEVDEVSFEVADPLGLWRGGWGPDEGTEITAACGYAGLRGGFVDCGLYAIDEPSAGGGSSGDTASFGALAAFTSKELRTKRSEGYDDMTLEAIVGAVAERHGLSVTGEIPELIFERISQNKEHDLAFLTRLADEWGCYFSVKGDQLVFTTRESVEDAPAVAHLDLVSGSKIKTWRVRRSTKDLYSKAVAKYLHPKTQQLVEAEAEDDRVPSGDTLKIDERAESQAHAERMVVARLARENDGLGTGDLTLVGNPMLIAGQVVALGGTFGRYAGRYLITSADQKFDAKGYVTTLQIKLI